MEFCFSKVGPIFSASSGFKGSLGIDNTGLTADVTGGAFNALSVGTAVVTAATVVFIAVGNAVDVPLLSMGVIAMAPEIACGFGVAGRAEIGVIGGGTALCNNSAPDGGEPKMGCIGPTEYLCRFGPFKLYSPMVVRGVAAIFVICSGARNC